RGDDRQRLGRSSRRFLARAAAIGAALQESKWKNRHCPHREACRTNQSEHRHALTLPALGLKAYRRRWQAVTLDGAADAANTSWTCLADFPRNWVPGPADGRT